MAKIKKYLPLFFTVLAMAGVLFLNMPVTSRQGVNYEVRALKMPLCIKVMEFFDRDYHYRQIVRGVIDRGDNDQKKILALFDWTCKNIRRVPQGFPVVDDHVLNIIIRGYGATDQFSDVFATLCNYAGLKAKFARAYAPDGKSKIILSVVQVDGRWRFFDPYHGVYFRNKEGGLADSRDILAGNWSVYPAGMAGDSDYAPYLANIRSLAAEGFARSNIQSPLRRFIYELKVRFKGKDRCKDPGSPAQ